MSGQFDPRITAYFGDAVLQAGFMPVPNLFLRHYAELDITTTQAMFLLQLMAIAWDIGSPPTNMSMLATRMGVSRRAAQLTSAELAARGIVEIFDQYDDQGAQVENGYDLGPLFQQLAALAPVSPIPGHQRQRRSRATGANEAQNRRHEVAAHTTLPQNAHISHPVKNISSPPMKNTSSSPVKNISSPPVKETSPAPGTPDRTTPEAEFTPPVKQASGLNKVTKNLVKKQLRKDQEQQQPAVAETQIAQIPGLAESDESVGGDSLRWGSVLSAADIIQSRQVLARIGINSDVADVVAATLHPAECWSLWTYARGARLGTAWIAKQIYDARRRMPRIAGIPGRYDQVGHLLAALPPAAAERMLDITEKCYPDEYAQLWPSGFAAEPDLSDVELSQVLDAVWHAFAAERGLPDQHRSSAHGNQQGEVLGSLTNPHVLRWPAIRDRLVSRVPPDDWNTWLAPLALLDIIDGVAVIGAPNLFVRSEVTARFETLLATALAEELGQELQIDLVIASPALAGK